MNINGVDKLYVDCTYRIRCIRSLIEQLKRDYADLNVLLNGVKNINRDIVEADEVMQRLSWIKEELKLLNKFKMMNIEGVLSSEIDQIEKDIMHIESHLNG